MENNKITNVILVIVGLLVLSFGFVGVSTDKGLTQEDLDDSINAALEQLSIPTAEEIVSLIDIPEVVIPEVENADNKLLNEFLEDQYANESNEIKTEAEEFALEELEDDDYKVIYNYLSSLFEGIDDETIGLVNSKTEVEVEVTELGLGEDEDKSALVTFDVKAKYKLEEGNRDLLYKNLIIVFSVDFDEGDFDDETVTLISIE